MFNRSNYWFCEEEFLSAHKKNAIKRYSRKPRVKHRAEKPLRKARWFGGRSCCYVIGFVCREL